MGKRGIYLEYNPEQGCYHYNYIKPDGQPVSLINSDGWITFTSFVCPTVEHALLFGARIKEMIDCGENPLIAEKIAKKEMLAALSYGVVFCYHDYDK